MDESADGARQRRQRRAAVAALLLARAPALAATLDWDALDASPQWLARADAALATLQNRVGAVLCAPMMRLWIDTARVAAARAALGDAFLDALLAQPDPRGLAAPPRITYAVQVAPTLAACGAAALLATLPAPLRAPASAVLVSPALIAIDAASAQSVIERALALGAAVGEPA
jgi:hypothetical protein